MGDIGEYWREHREWKQARRRHWHECPTCRVSFGTGTSVAPGRTCRHCGWLAPGEIGEDNVKARAEMTRNEPTKDRSDKRCLICGKWFKTARARNQHREAKHARRLRRERAQ